LHARPLNADNKLCNADGNELIFPNRIDTSASNSGYEELDPNTESLNNTLELEKFILTTIEQRIQKNNILVASRIVKKAVKKPRFSRKVGLLQ